MATPPKGKAFEAICEAHRLADDAYDQHYEAATPLQQMKLRLAWAKSLEAVTAAIKHGLSNSTEISNATRQLEAANTSLEASIRSMGAISKILKELDQAARIAISIATLAI